MRICRFLVLAGLAPMAAMGQDANPPSPDFEGSRATPLGEQDIDPNAQLLDLLERAASKGPVFRISPREVSMSGIPGETLSETVRVTNVGDEDGEVRGVNTLGRFNDLELVTDCGGVLEIGSFCEFTISYDAPEPDGASRDASLRTAIAGAIDERERSSFEVPVSIEVTRPSAGPEAPAVQPVPQPVMPKETAPQPRDIAQSFLSARSAMMRPQAGFAVVRPETPLSERTFRGVRFGDIEVTERRTDPRYDPGDVASVDASLPVDRSRILTTDRVIKAVLETPVSNVMCNKVVATIESDVYSATSGVPLIPAGSRAVGECGEFAGERAAIAWERIITTDGRNISFDIAADTNAADGRGGATGRIYLSRFDRYVLPIFSTAVDAASGVVTAIFGENETVVVDENGNRIQENSARNEGIRIVTDGARSATQQLIEEIRDVREVAVIPAGSRVDIEINEDIYFKDSRRIVRVADLEFELDGRARRSAERTDPEAIRLVPVGSDFDGPTVMVDGRAYRIEERIAVEENGETTFEFRRPEGAQARGEADASTLAQDGAQQGTESATQR